MSGFCDSVMANGAERGLARETTAATVAFVSDSPRGGLSWLHSHSRPNLRACHKHHRRLRDRTFPTPPARGLAQAPPEFAVVVQIAPHRLSVDPVSHTGG